MNEMSEFRRANAGAAPAGPSGASRLKTLLMGAAGGGLMVAAGVYVATLALPVFLHPGIVAGTAAGETEKADIDAKAATVIAYEHGKADAATQAQVKGQVDAMVTQKTLDTITESYAPVTVIAGGLDAACLLGRLLGALTAPTGRVIGDWRNGNTDFNTPGFNQTANAVADATCNKSAPLRNGVLAAQLGTVSQVAATRGMSMNDGAVKVASAPEPAAAGRPGMVNLALAPHRHLNADQQRDLRFYAYGMPVDVLRVLVNGLDMTHGTPDGWYDRVAYYRDARNG